MNDQMTVSFPGGKRVTASYGAFEITTDQSEKYGGEASAPEPFDLFLASLATCAGAYVLGFCANRGIDTEGLRLSQSWRRNDKGALERVELKIEIPEDFPEKYREALVRVANKCAVKKVLENPPEMLIETIELTAV